LPFILPLPKAFEDPKRRASYSAMLFVQLNSSLAA
jgi:hypothetical protein